MPHPCCPPQSAEVNMLFLIATGPPSEEFYFLFEIKHSNSFLAPSLYSSHPLQQTREVVLWEDKKNS